MRDEHLAKPIFRELRADAGEGRWDPPLVAELGLAEGREPGDARLRRAADSVARVARNATKEREGARRRFVGIGRGVPAGAVGHGRRELGPLWRREMIVGKPGGGRIREAAAAPERGEGLRGGGRLEPRHRVARDAAQRDEALRPRGGFRGVGGERLLR